MRQRLSLSASLSLSLSLRQRVLFTTLPLFSVECPQSIERAPSECALWGTRVRELCIAGGMCNGNCKSKRKSEEEEEEKAITSVMRAGLAACTGEQRTKVWELGFVVPRVFVRVCVCSGGDKAPIV
mmetsp:Transcript_34750/g.71704  ORF Transcript_34750/g.71704 Transcript_34750/m.71704 type:complete len:126 (+) Transcript_34750:603-980(+)